MTPKQMEIYGSECKIHMHLKNKPWNVKEMLDLGQEAIITQGLLWWERPQKLQIEETMCRCGQ